jgi:tRNA A-37 threonylcarbamoyl transferase component Bud32
MKTHNGNIGKINADVGKITFETLEKFDIPYDEIYFGKPYADFYIDDLAVNCFDDMEKELGFYNNKINPRDFHKIELDSINTITKTGEMSGENYYYTFIPNSLKDLFPVYIDGNDTYITIEKIQGVTVTELYLSELLTKETLVHILNSIQRIHSQTNNNQNNDYQNNDYQNNDHYDNFNENIYLNYSQKLRERYNSYNYSSYTNSEIIYQNILKQLEIYEKNQLGIKSIIHGDPVFTNILINKHSKIKFIDMRGRLGDNLTIYGDKLYDWAKIYQSLIGYDEILMSKIVNSDYKNNLIEVFKNYFIKQFSLDDLQNLKMITKSLLFSLVPLHNNEKCQQYFNLINSEYLI